ncbi:MAG: hypothetical protein KGY70_11250 [Bacteroidales bacterium]|nr:hypothetical protein [Bacteroidales bacterium]
MKKKIISFVGLLLFVGVVAYNVYMANSSNLAYKLNLTNIEAVASGSAICYWNYSCGINKMPYNICEDDWYCREVWVDIAYSPAQNCELKPQTIYCSNQKESYLFPILTFFKKIFIG